MMYFGKESAKCNSMAFNTIDKYNHNAMRGKDETF